MFFKENIEPNDLPWKKIDFLVLHLGMCLLFIIVYRSLGLLDIFPLEEKLSQWDTGWYDSIRVSGYQYAENEQSNSGFFPLFPYLWRWMGVGVVGISLFNALLVIMAWLLLYRAFDFRKSEFLMVMALPTTFFLFVPYTESLFFFGCTLALVGIKQESYWEIFLGLLMASLTRSTAVFLVPAVVYMVLLGSRKDNLLNKETLGRLARFLAPVLLAIVVVVVWQWAETGVWFAYYKAQAAHWFRSISLPSFPLSTWNHPQILWIDAAAFLAGAMSLWMIVRRLWLWFKHGGDRSGSSALYLSEGYLCMVFISLLLVNPKNIDSGLTEISGANRYIFATPFFFLFTQQLLSGNYKLKKLTYVMIPLVLLLFNLYVWPQPIIFACLALYLMNFVAVVRRDLPDHFLYILYLVNLGTQFYLFDQFIQGKWVG